MRGVPYCVEMREEWFWRGYLDHRWVLREIYSRRLNLGVNFEDPVIDYIKIIPLKLLFLPSYHMESLYIPLGYMYPSLKNAVFESLCKE